MIFAVFVIFEKTLDFMKSRLHLFAAVPLIFLGTLATLSLGSEKCHAQSSLEAIRSYGISPNVPPVSDPVCVYCGANRSNSSRREPHRKGYPCYEAEHPTQASSSQTSSSQVDPSNPAGNYHRVTYNQTQTVYVPPKPIRDTPEGQAMLQVAEAAGYAVGTLLAKGLWSLGSKIFHGGGKDHNYHNANPDKQWGIYGIKEERGKEGIWDNAKGGWQIKPGKYCNIRMVDLNGSPMQSVKTGKWGIVDINTKGGKEIMPCEFDEIISYGVKNPGNPVALAMVDEQGYTHWIIGHVRQAQPWDFVVWDGEYSNVELTSRPNPIRGDEETAVIAKDYKTGKSKVMDYRGNAVFGGRSDEKYDDIILTGMVNVKKQTDSKYQFWEDYYKVKNNGKMGFVAVTHNADQSRSLGSQVLLECEYDNITPIEHQMYEAVHNYYAGASTKELVITEKDGKYGLGYAFSRNARNPQYTGVYIKQIQDMDGTLIPIAVVTKGDGVYEVVELSGMSLFWDDGSAITGKSLDKTFKMAERYLKTSSRWKQVKAGIQRYKEQIQ